LTKKAIRGKEARQKLMNGIRQVADAVAPTLGPSARYVMLERPYGSPLVLNDGVSIANDIESDDPYEMMGIRLIQEVASNAQAHGGDGTTTATLIATKLCEEGLTLLEDSFNPLNIKLALEVMLSACEEYIDDLVIVPEDEEERKQQIFEVATVAANNDPELGALIADALQQTNYEGIITVEESHNQTRFFRG
jgi:chaperonin GroEL